MSRKKRVYKRSEPFDVINNSALIGKFINCLMLDGKKSVVASAVHKAVNKLIQSPLLAKVESLPKNASADEIFKHVVSITTPSVETKSRRIGGSNYQIPHVISGTTRALSLSIRWIVAAIRSKKDMALEDKVFAVFEDSLNFRGEALKKKTQIEAVAEANRAYAHLANNNRR